MRACVRVSSSYYRYYGAVSASMELAKVEGPYLTFPGSPMSEGKFQFDLWGVAPSSARFDWAALRADVVKHGVRNSLLIAPMPTASTSQILGNNECFEPFTSNVYARRVLAGDFTVVNKHMLRDLIEGGWWTEEIRNQIIADGGSIQSVGAIPQTVKDLYKTVWEISQKAMLQLAVDRGPFICQSQSLNVHIASPTMPKMSSMHFFAWKSGLKTGMYYLRTRPKASAIQFTVDQKALAATRAKLPGGGGAGKPEPALADAAANIIATGGATIVMGAAPKLQVIETEECLNCGS